MAEPTLLERLRTSELLSAEQLAELELLPEASNLDPKVLARVVLQRGWLTKFQISLIATGKGKELFVGPYVLLDRLGEGGMGQVLKARHQHMKRFVALKLIRKEKLASGDAVSRFYQEVEAAAQLHHPNIVLAFDAGQAGSTHFFAMEYVEGPDLTRLVKEKGALPVAQACDFIRQAAIGLQHAHERGLVHRDIKPSNLLVTAGGAEPVVKILDLGLARLGDTFAKERNLTKMGQVIGTPDYLAPEQALDARHVDIRADIYSLGCSLYFLLATRAPFQAESLAELLMKHQIEEPVSIRSLRPDVPVALEEVLRRMMAKKPQDRPSTPAEVAAALEPFARGEQEDHAQAPRAFTIAPPLLPPQPEETWGGLSSHGPGVILKSAVRQRDRARADTIIEKPRGRRKPEKNNKGLLIGGVVVGVGVLLLSLGVFLLSPKKPVKTVEKKKPPVEVVSKPAEIPKGDPPVKPGGDGPSWSNPP